MKLTIKAQEYEQQKSLANRFWALYYSEKLYHLYAGCIRIRDHKLEISIPNSRIKKARNLWKAQYENEFNPP